MTGGPITKSQIAKITTLVDRVGVGAYRDAKKTIGVSPLKQVRTLTRNEANILLVLLRRAR